MSESWDDDDRAIAALDESDAPDGPVDDAAVDEYRHALSQFPFDEVPPPPDLEARVMSEALARRPSTTVSLEGQRLRRRAQVRWAALGAVAGAAVAVVALLVVNTTTPSSPTASIEAVSVQRADVEAALAQSGTRTGELSGAGLTGSVALTAEGAGFVYDLAIEAPGGNATWLWLETSDGFVRVGELPFPLPRDVEFDVDGEVDAVRGVVISLEQSATPPDAPSMNAAFALLD